MQLTEILANLRSKNETEVLNIAEIAANKLEEMEERIAIMGETLNKKEWTRTGKRAKARTKIKNVGGRK